jgi:hypothetical protein
MSHAPADVTLSRSTLMTVRRVLHAYREGWLLEGRFAVAARMIAEDAHQRGLAAERMLVALKQAWTALDEVRRMSPREAQTLSSRLIALTIRAYYESSGTPLGRTEGRDTPVRAGGFTSSSSASPVP